ncbi:hypothetical protein VP01_9992g1, partial [Puccinia sorghi]
VQTPGDFGFGERDVVDHPFGWPPQRPQKSSHYHPIRPVENPVEVSQIALSSWTPWLTKSYELSTSLGILSPILLEKRLTQSFCSNLFLLTFVKSALSSSSSLNQSEDEAKHSTLLLRGAMRRLGSDWGELPIHDAN